MLSTNHEAKFVWMWSCVVKQRQSVRSLHQVMVPWMSQRWSRWQLRSFTSKKNTTKNAYRLISI